MQLRKTADALEEDLKRTEYSGRTITLIYKLETYEGFTRSKTPGGYLATADQLYRYVTLAIAMIAGNSTDDAIIQGSEEITRQSRSGSSDRLRSTAEGSRL